MTLDPRLLTAFVAVAEARSFSKAATAQNIAQPWLSRQVRKLEGLVGFDLFDRTARQVELTEKGRRLFDRARVAVSHVRATAALAKTLARERESSRLAIGVAPYGIFVAPRTALIDRFMAVEPNARVELEIGGADKLIDGLQDGRLDAVFAIDAPGLELGEDLESIALCEGGIDVVMPKDDPLARKNRIHAGDLAGRSMATFSRASHGVLFDMVFGAFEPAGVKLREVSDYSFFLHLAERGQITALPAWQPLPVGGLVRRPYPDCGVNLSFKVTRSRSNASRPLSTFWQIASEIAAA
ncbi:HTH-type transcriptional regulator BenM [Alphaproteobacteria bacterium SO-S41]|nr:HTH-type transcriptional regulator BenM [Alphaproteobacteria bacterium SO-S41]